MLLCCEEKANQMQDKKPQVVTVITLKFVFVFQMVLISHLIGHRTIKNVMFTAFGVTQ